MAGTTRRTRGALLMMLGLILMAAGAISPAAAAPDQNNECNGAFEGSPAGSLAITSVPPAGITGGATEIVVTVTWDPAEWADPDELDKLVNCIKVDGALVDSLSSIDKPTDNDGTHVFTIDLTGLDVGDEVCDRARLSGQPAPGNQSTQKSNELCWIVSDGQTPPPPPDTYSLTVRKTVVNGIGNESFTFTVDCDPAELDASNVSGATFTDGAATFDLANGGTKEITGLPEQASCEVTESVPASPQWTTKINNVADDDRSTVVDIAGDDREVVFENTRVNPTPPPDDTPVVAPQQETAPAVAGVQVTREAAPAVAPARQAETIAATGMSTTLFVLGMALLSLGALLVVGAGKTARPAGNHYLA